MKTKIAFLIVVMILVLLGMVWANYGFTVENPGGNDFLVHWMGTRSLITENLSPYSDEVALKIQTIAYGRPAHPGEHEMRVAYPLYSEIIFTPFALIGNYNFARALWMTLLELGLIALAFLSIRLTEWHPRLGVLGVYFGFSLLWYHAVRPVINGNIVILVSLLIVIALLTIRNGSDEIAGLVLGLTTIKPHLVVVFILFVFIWAISHKRWRIIVWTLSSVVFLSIISMVVIPDWMLQNLREILRFSSYNPPGTPIAVLATWLPGIGKQMGLAFTGLLVLGLFVEWWFSWKKDFRWFLWTTSLTLVISQWIGIQTDPGNFILLFLPIVLIFTIWTERWGTKSSLPAIVGMVTLFIGLWVIFLLTLESGNQHQQNSVMFFPLPLILILGLYWIRWWALSHRLLDALRSL